MPDQADQLDRLKAALADRYRIERELGRGGMATVYLAEDLRHERKVAVKVLRPELAAALGPERFLREIKLTANLDHPHVLPLHDSGEADGFLYYVMPYVEGESLRERLNREKQLPIDAALRIAQEVAGALDFAHQRDVIHRDIKPENILLAAGHARVADFGIARALSAAGGDRLTETGAAVGTPHYMSPEQASGGQVDGRTDIYALACVLYEMLGGDPPFTGSSAQAVLARKVVDQVPSLRTLRDTVSEPIERVVMKALAKAPADRHGTAGQMAEELRTAAREEVVQGTGRPQRRVGRRAALALPVLAAMTVALWLGFKTFGRDELPITRLAILPLENLTGDTEQEYLVDGIHSELIAALGRIPGLTVISQSSVMPFKDQQKALRDIAVELNVQALVEGSVFLAGDTVRVMAQLVRAVPEEQQLWAESYDGSLSSPLGLLDRTAEAIAEQIQVTLTADERFRPTARRVVDSEAYHLVKKGEHQIRMGWIREAEASFQQALGRDSTYAPAHVGLASIYNGKGFFDTALPEDAYPRARAAALKALEFDSTLAEAHEQLAWTRGVFDWDWSGAEDELRHALSLKPGSVVGHISYAFLLHWERRYAEAVHELDRALELDPLSVAMRLSAANMFRRMRQCDRGVEEAHEASKLERELHVQGPRDPRFVIGLCYLQQRRFQEGMPLLEAGAERAMPRYAVRYTAELAHAYGVTGSRSAALDLLADVLDLTRSQYVPPYLVAMIYTGLGDKDSAFAWLDKAVDVRDNWLAFVNVEPRWDLLRSDPRFSRLLSQMNFPK